MAYSKNFHEEEGDDDDNEELLKYDDSEEIIELNARLSSSPSSHRSASLSPTTTRSRVQPGFNSEMSMDLTDLHDVLEDVSSHGNNRFSSAGLGCSNSISLHGSGGGEDIDARGSDDSDNDSDSDNGFNVQSMDNNRRIKFDDITEDLFDSSDLLSLPFVHSAAESSNTSRRHLSMVDEESEQSEHSLLLPEAVRLVSSRISSLSSSNSNQGSTESAISRRKVKFQISARLEDIIEFEKPDPSDHHLLYYTSHELQKMIDGQRADDQRDGSVDR